MSNDDYQHQTFCKNMEKVAAINTLIKALKKESPTEAELISDGYHTFTELYQHRILLFIALCKEYSRTHPLAVWKSQWNSEGVKEDGWFLMGLHLPAGEITYHLSMEYWDMTSFVTALDQAPKWDGHTSKDVLERLETFIKLP